MRFQKKPVMVGAVQWTGDNIRELVTFVGHGLTHEPDERVLLIHTLEGKMRAEVGDWIICGVKGEFYPCKPDVFAATYEPAEDTR